MLFHQRQLVHLRFLGTACRSVYSPQTGGGPCDNFLQYYGVGGACDGEWDSLYWRVAC